MKLIQSFFMAKEENTPDVRNTSGISQVSAFSYDSAEHLEKVFGNKAPGFAYTRIGNPTVAAFEQRINELEGGVGAVACASGMAHHRSTVKCIKCWR